MGSTKSFEKVWRTDINVRLAWADFAPELMCSQNRNSIKIVRGRERGIYIKRLTTE